MASPPSDAVGVVRLKASPAIRTASSVRKGTRSRRKAYFQPSVSNVVTRTKGKTAITASRHDRPLTAAKIAAGSLVTTRTPRNTRPTTRSSARSSFMRAPAALSFPGRAAAGRQTPPGRSPTPDPAGDRPAPPASARASEPSRSRPRDAERRVGDFQKELRLEVQAGVRVREQEPAADGAQQRKDERRPRRAQPPGAHRPLEQAEG